MTASASTAALHSNTATLEIKSAAGATAMTAAACSCDVAAEANKAATAHSNVVANPDNNNNQIGTPARKTHNPDTVAAAKSDVGNPIFPRATMKPEVVLYQESNQWPQI